MIEMKRQLMVSMWDAKDLEELGKLNLQARLYDKFNEAFKSVLAEAAKR